MAGAAVAVPRAAGLSLARRRGFAGFGRGAIPHDTHPRHAYAQALAMNMASGMRMCACAHVPIRTQA